MTLKFTPAVQLLVFVILLVIAVSVATAIGASADGLPPQAGGGGFHWGPPWSGNRP
ncbi:MAG TPA: hypothetical protein PKK40_01110 [Marmoricola sp.]|nr:hypothetical protein [Marmoricola sp.]